MAASDTATNTAIRASTQVIVGRIQGAYGIKGWVHIATYTEPRDNILSYSPWYLGRDRAGSRDWREVNLLEIRPHKQGFVARLTGVDDRNAAEALRGALIAVPEEELPALASDEFYWRDLIGSRVIDQHDHPLGKVQDLIETGAHDVLVIERVEEQRHPADTDADNDSEKEALLVPFHRQYVLEVDLRRGVIRVDWQVEAEQGPPPAGPAPTDAGDPAGLE